MSSRSHKRSSSDSSHSNSSSSSSNGMLAEHGSDTPSDSNFVTPNSTDGLLSGTDASSNSSGSSPRQSSRKSRGAVSPEDQAKKDRAQRIDKIHDKLHALFWVGLAAVVFVSAEVWETTFDDDDDINSLALNLAVICFFANVSIMLYLAVWLPYIEKVDLPWDIYCPKMVPSATALGVASYVLFIIAYWPAWGFLSPVIVTILLFGLIFSAHFIPSS